MSVGWAAVLVAVLPRRHTVAFGVAAGVAIAAIDVRIASGRFPVVAALPRAPQVADHAAFGALVGAVMAHRLRRGPRR